MPEPTHRYPGLLRPMTRDEARAEYQRMLARLDGVEAPRVLVQPDDPGHLTTCVRCGEPEAWGPMRLCAAHQPAPEPWWAHLLRLVDERACLLRMVRRVKRDLASLGAWLGGEP